MPWKSEWVENEVFLTHNEINIYHTYKMDELSSGQRENWFTTDPNGCEHDDPYQFDVCDLTTYDKSNREATIIAALDAGEIELFKE